MKVWMAGAWCVLRKLAQPRTPYAVPTGDAVEASEPLFGTQYGVVSAKKEIATASERLRRWGSVVQQSYPLTPISPFGIPILHRSVSRIYFLYVSPFSMGPSYLLTRA